MKKTFVLGLIVVLSLAAESASQAVLSVVRTEKEPGRADFRQIRVSSGERMACCDIGETMVLKVDVVGTNGQPVAGLPIAWKRRGDDGRTETGKLVSASEPVEVAVSMDCPGEIRFDFSADEQKSAVRTKGFSGGVMVAPEKIRAAAAPVDLEAFWTKARQDLARVPLRVLEERVSFSNDVWCVYDLKIACAGKRPVSGYLTVPRKAAPGTLPIAVYFYGYSVGSAERHFDPKAITFGVNAHGIENGREEAYYTALASGELANYALNRVEKPEESYFLGMCLRAARAVEYMKTRPEWDGKTLRVAGHSQGGYQALMAASLDPDVTRVEANEPWMCDVGSAARGGLAGFDPAYSPALAYFDPVHLLKQTRAEVDLIAGLADDTCPAGRIAAVWNAAPGRCRITFYQAKNHGWEIDWAPAFRLEAGVPADFEKLLRIAESGDRNYVFVNAHRGAVDPAKRIPENSLAAVRHAIELGCDIIEVDPKTTRDGRVILSHDNRKLDQMMKFPRGVDGQSTVADIPYEGPAGSVCFRNARLRVTRNSSDVTEERPCTWEELLDACRGKCFIQADCTHYNCMPDWKKVWEPVVRRGMERQVRFKVGPRDGSGIMPPGQDEPEGMCGYFWSSVKWKASEPVPEQTFRDRLAEDSSANRLQAQTIGRYGHDQSGEYGDRTSLDFDVRVGWDKFLDFGATVFMTDYPEEMIRHLEKRGRRVAKPNDTRRRILPPFVANQDYTGEEIRGVVAPGVYSVVAHLDDPKTTRWADGTDGEKRIFWRLRDRPRLYKEGTDFLAYLAAHPKRVARSPYAKGGDIVLRFMEAGKASYVHIYTNTLTSGTFEPAHPLDGRILVLGGGGGAGASAKKGPWTFFCARGGAGGRVVEKVGVRLDRPLAITVGVGGKGADKGEGAAGGTSRITFQNGLAIAADGGVGGAAGVVSDKNTYSKGGDGAGGKGLLGLNAKGRQLCGGRGWSSDILGEKLEFGGGGAAASHGNNNLDVSELSGGAGGGGASVSSGYNAQKYFSEAGRDGLGGGGAGGHMKGTKASTRGEDGGSGLVLIGYTVAPQYVTISCDPTNAVVSVNEKATFTIAVRDARGSLLPTGSVTVVLDNLGAKQFVSNRVDLAQGNPFELSGRLSEPGCLRVKVMSPAIADPTPYNEGVVVFSCAVDPFRFTQRYGCPADFDTYWSAARARLAAEVPLDPRIAPDPAHASDPDFAWYHVSFATFGRRVYGLLIVPRDVSPGTRLPACVQVPGAGFGSWSHVPDTRKGCISLFLSVFPWQLETDFEPNRVKYDRMNEDFRARKLDVGTKPDTTCYHVSGIARSREDYFYHPVILGMDRAVDWLARRSDVDPKRITYHGTSQGGAFGLFLMGLNRNFARGVVYVPALTGQHLREQGLEDTWPWFADSARTNAAYFDTVNFAARVRCPIRFVAGLADTLCPPTGVLAAYNACPASDKDIVLGVGMSHNVYAWIYQRLTAWEVSRD